jgi:hypothetical protein
MKKSIVLILFCCNICHGIAQIDTTEFRPTIPPDSTEIGKPEGTSNSKLIGAAGGQIISADGRIELNFPVGALTSNTTISIQPTANHAPNGTGKAYSLEPSGTKFKKPVRFFFHYTDEEAERCHPELMGFAQQDHKGKWSFVDYDNWDSTGKTLVGSIHHFSAITNLNKLAIYHNSSPLQVTRRAWLEIVDITREFHSVSRPGMVEMVPAHLQMGDRVEWFVNGIRNGNDKVGTITPRNHISREERDQFMFARYLAPEIMPAENPVKIVAAIYVYSRSRRREIRVLSNQMRIFDSYRIKVEHTEEYRVGMDNDVSDSASFVVWVHPKSIFLLHINNYPAWLSREGRGRAGCKLHIDPGSAMGSIHLTDGYRNVQISRESPPEVLFEFLPTYHQPEFTFWWECRRAGITTDPEVMYGIPLAPEINFLANGREQTINVQDNHRKYKITVKPYRIY